MKDWRRGSIWASRRIAFVLASLASTDASLPSASAAPNLDPPAVEAPVERRPIDFGEIDELVEQAVHEGKTPGAVVVVGRRDGILFQRAYGERAVLPARREMTLDTIFDLASLTKPLVTGTLAAWLIERGELRLSDTVSKYLPEFSGQSKENVTVEELLLHTSGLPPSNPLRDYRQGRQHARDRAIGSVLEAYPGRKFIYSDVGYIVLGMLIERVTGEPLDVTARRVIWAPLSMGDTQYCRTPCESPRIAPTELASGRHVSPIRGEVQDPRAYLLGGVAGNAGVFSTGEDLSRFARMLLGQGELDGVRILSAEAVHEFTEPRPVPGGGVRSLGWDVSSHYSRARGVALSEQAFGHGGYTGTSLWIDPSQDLFVIMLSNRNHPFGRGNVLQLQGTIADAAVRALHAAQAVHALHAEHGVRALHAEHGVRAMQPANGLGTPPDALGRLQLPSELPAPRAAAPVDSLQRELRRGGG